MRQDHRSISRNILISLFGLAALVIGYFAVSGRLPIGAPDPSIEDTAPSPVPVRTAKAEVRKLTAVLDLIGSIQPDPKKNSVLAASTNGIIERLAVSEGTRVAKNDLVIQLDERPAQLSL